MNENRLLPGLRLVVALVGVLFIACSNSSASLRVDTVSPAHLSPGTTSQIVVTGTGFRRGDRVRFGSVEALNTVWVSSGALSVTPPAAIPAGRYAVLVVAPDGRQAMKSNAVEVGAASRSGVGVRPAAVVTASPAAAGRASARGDAPASATATPRRAGTASSAPGSIAAQPGPGEGRAKTRQVTPVSPRDDGEQQEGGSKRNEQD